MLVVFGFELDVVVRSEGSRETVGDNGAQRSELDVGRGLLAEGVGDHSIGVCVIDGKLPADLEIYLFLL